MANATSSRSSLPEPKFSAEDFPGCPEIEVPKGRFVLFEGEEHAGTCYLVLEGKLDVRLVTPGGHETLLYELGPGDLVGEIGAFGRPSRTASILARTPSRLLRIAPERFHERMRDPGFHRRITALFLDRYLRSHEVVCRLSQPTIAAKLCRYLLSLPEWKDAERALTLRLPSHSELAHMLSCQRETVTRAMRQLATLGVVRANEDRTHTINRERAQAFLEEAG